MEVGDASSGRGAEARAGRAGRSAAGPAASAAGARCARYALRAPVAGGGWRERVVFRQALSDPERIRLALSLRLLLLPAPACALGLTVERFGPPRASRARCSIASRAELRAARLREAVAQMRAVAGADAALRAVCVDPDSRVPERRMVLAPIPE